MSFFVPFPIINIRRPTIVLEASRANEWTPTTSNRVKTLSNVPIGTPSADRYVIACVGYPSPGVGTTASLDTVSIGGVSAEFFYGSKLGVSMWGAVISTGTTANIVGTWSAAFGNTRAPMLLYTLYDYKSTSPYLSESNTSGTGPSPLSTSLNTTYVSGGAHLVIAFGGTSSWAVPPTSLTLTPSRNQQLAGSSMGTYWIVGNDGYTNPDNYSSTIVATTSTTNTRISSLIWV